MAAAQARSMWPQLSVKEDAPVKVLRNSLVVGALGGVSGTVVSVLRTSQIEPVVAAWRMSKGWFAFSFGFFGTHSRYED